MTRVVIIPPVATNSIGVITERIWSCLSSWIVKGRVEDFGCVEHPHRSLPILVRKVLDSLADCFIEPVGIRSHSLLRRCRLPN